MRGFVGEQSHFNTDCDAILLIITTCYTLLPGAKVEELSRLVAQPIGSAILLNMSEVPIIAIERAKDTMVTRIQATDTAGIGRVVLEVRGHPSEVSEMLEKIRGYPKWW
ncbi:hypothetical protein MTYM_00870 [Methylococcales bacterium]|nr:hypothetical protein MTYM_00870 [Methylococcales bacterium]